MLQIDGNVRLPSQSSAHNDVASSPGLQSDGGYMPTDQPSQMPPRYSNSSGHFNDMQVRKWPGCLFLIFVCEIEDEFEISVTSHRLDMALHHLLEITCCTYCILYDVT